jgi:hypothetical protein
MPMRGDNGLTLKKKKRGVFFFHQHPKNGECAHSP